MYRKIFSSILVFVFVFTLAMTAWAYCPSSTENSCSNMHEDVTHDSRQFENLHHSCISLNDVYDILPFVQIKPEQENVSIKILHNASRFIVELDQSNSNNLSPPSRGSPFQETALYLQYSILRI